MAAIDDSEPTACILIFKSFDLPDFFAFGDPTAVKFIVSSIDLPARVYSHIHFSHEAVIRPLYVWENLRLFRRMYVTADAFKPHATPAERLGPEKAQEVVSFYTEHPGSFFLPEMLEPGPYFCVRSDERIVSIAGVHVVSKTHGLGNLGNVSTDSKHRRKGHASACVSAVLCELFSTGCQHVFLNVESDNVPAVELYRSLGFQTHCEYLEGVGSLKPLP